MGVLNRQDLVAEIIERIYTGRGGRVALVGVAIEVIANRQVVVTGEVVVHLGKNLVIVHIVVHPNTRRIQSDIGHREKGEQLLGGRIETALRNDAAGEGLAIGRVDNNFAGKGRKIAADLRQARHGQQLRTGAAAADGRLVGDE